MPEENREVEFEIVPESLAPIQSAKIISNFDDCREKLTQMMAPYAGMVVQEGDQARAKADRAQIRKLAQRVDDLRKTAKNICLRPFQEFEQQCKTLSGICQEAAENLDKQVKAFEEKEKQQKALELAAYFQEMIDEDTGSFIRYSDIADPRWLNKSVPLSNAKAAIDSQISRCRGELAGIRGMNSPFETALLEEYRRKKNIADVITLLNDLKEREKREKARQATPPPPAPPAIQSPRQTAAPVQSAPGQAATEEETHSVDFRVWVTKAQLATLKAFLLQHKIKYGRVPKEEIA